jgi:hypothetical protein
VAAIITATPTTSITAPAVDLAATPPGSPFKRGQRIRIQRNGIQGVLLEEVDSLDKNYWTIKWDSGRESDETLRGRAALKFDLLDGGEVPQGTPASVPPSSTPESGASMPTPRSPFPDHWTGQGVDVDFPFVDITPSRKAKGHADEYAGVKKSLQDKLGTGAIVWQVWRVQDEGAWKHFEVEREKLMRLGFPDEEPELWHSTCHTDPFKVCKDGFDLSYAKEITDHNKDAAARSSAYGLGLYFAAHPLYSHCIVPCHANCAGDEYTGYFLIRVRMLLGHVMDYKEQLAEDILHTPKGYHSWKGTETDLQHTFGQDDIKNNRDVQTLKKNGKEMGRQHITQKAAMVYPEYIIRYTRE